MVNISEKDIVRMETYLEKYVKNHMSLLQDLSYYSIGITRGEEFRVSLYYDDIKKGRDIIQPQVKEIMKEAFGLDKIKLEVCYEGCEGKETLFEILYDVPKNIYHMIHVLSKLKEK